MKILALLRHAKSDWDDLAKRDFDRGLNERGRKGGRLIGEHIREHGISWDSFIASPAERVKQTMDSAFPDEKATYDARLYLASSDTILEVVTEKAGDADAVMVVGHNPGLQDVLLELISPANENALFDEASTKFPTAAFAVLECDIDDWSKLKTGVGKLVHFARPRDLDPELGPEF
ncbi:MAG: histidine phosphatase family protein [Erythrobacter sp.]